MGLLEGKLEEHTKISSSLMLRVCTLTLQFILKPTNFRAIIFNNLSSLYLILVDGQYVEDGWVDKTCKVCKKDTQGEPRQVDNLGRYVHVACSERSKSGNFFTRLFSG